MRRIGFKLLVGIALAGLVVVMPLRAGAPRFSWAISGGNSQFDFLANLRVAPSGDLIASGESANPLFPFPRPDGAVGFSDSGEFWLDLSPRGEIREGTVITRNLMPSMDSDASGRIFAAGTIQYPGFAWIDSTQYRSAVFATNGAFVLAQYDSRRTLQWSRQFGNKDTSVLAFQIDAQTNLNAVGTFAAPITFDSVTLTNVSSGQDQFVAQFDAHGQTRWARGGTSQNPPTQIIQDYSGNLIWCGNGAATFGSVVLPNGVGRLQQDFCLVKFTREGGVAWGRQSASPSPSVFVSAAAADRDGSIYVCGTLHPPGGSGSQFATFDTTNVFVGNGSTFLAKFDRNGSFNWLTLLGLPWTNTPSALHLAADPAGTCFVSTPDGLFKIGSNGQIIWTRACPPHSLLAVDSSDRVFLAGERTNSVSFDDINLPYNGSNSLFIACLDGNRLQTSQSGNKAIITWPSGAAGVTLESSPTPSGPWTLAAHPPTGTGEDMVFTNADLSSPALFFRLRD